MTFSVGLKADYRYCTRPGKKLWNSYLRLTRKIYNPVNGSLTLCRLDPGIPYGQEGLGTLWDAGCSAEPRLGGANNVISADCLLFGFEH